MVGNKGNKKQSTATAGSASAPSEEATVGEDEEATESEGDGSYPVQEQLHDQEYVIY
jgi:hypothetical protein